MTLHVDVAELLAVAGIPGVDVDDAVADEHVRWSAYRRIVSVIASSPSRDRDRAIVATILRDPVEMVAKSAVVALVDEIATRTAGPAEFREWASGLLPEIDGPTGCSAPSPRGRGRRRYSPCSPSRAAGRRRATSRRTEPEVAS
ncbi:hypothetical protein V6574_32925 [Streptomyces sp. SM1P]